MTKLNPTTMKTQYDGQYDTFCRKNHDYGNSFEESLDQFGIIASLVRMQDKMLRLQSLTDESKTQQVGSESLLDTLEDLSNYAAMTACWLKGVQAEDDVKYDEPYQKRMLNSLYGAHIFRTPGENWKMTQCDNGFKPLGPEVTREKHDDSDIVDIFKYSAPDMQFWRKPGTPFTPLGPEIIHEPQLTDEAYDFLEEQVTRAVEYMAHIRAHGRAPQNKDIGDYAYDIARYALEQYPDPYRIIQHMGQILAMRSLNPNDALLFCSRVTDYIRNMNTKEKGSNKAKAMDKARWNVIAIGARGAGKGFAKTRSLMEELGVPKETIKEIFEDLEDDDDE
jgi:hypothetical protein